MQLHRIGLITPPAMPIQGKNRTEFSPKSNDLTFGSKETVAKKPVVKALSGLTSLLKRIPCPIDFNIKTLQQLKASSNCFEIMVGKKRPVYQERVGGELYRTYHLNLMKNRVTYVVEHETGTHAPIKEFYLSRSGKVSSFNKMDTSYNSTGPKDFRLNEHATFGRVQADWVVKNPDRSETVYFYSPTKGWQMFDGEKNAFTKCAQPENIG